MSSQIAPAWRDDSELFALMREKLFTAVVGDILDDLGFMHQFLPREVRPLRDDMVLAGRAMTVVEADLDDDAASGKPFGLMLEALDDLRPNEIYVAGGGSGDYAMWGELMTARALRLGATGAVVNGSSRDTRGILAQGFAVFSRGPYAQDQRRRGEVLDFRVPVEFGNTRISPGDIIFGDVDGVLAIPAAVEQDALRRALEKVAKENLVRRAIEQDGMSAVQALATFGVI